MKKLRQGGFLMAKVHQTAGRIFNKLLKKDQIEEINSAQGRILFVLWEKDNIPISELSKKTQLEKSTLTSMLDKLENDGFIIRLPSKEDRRKILIQRTEKDKQFQEKYLAISDEMNNLFYKNFSELEIDLFEKSLQKILDNLIKEKNKKLLHRRQNLLNR
jgi:DNA-binding MarR family transcriptional regulator